MPKKECPACAMEIGQNERTCPICGYQFPQTNRLHQIVAVLLVLLFLYFMIF